MPKTAIKQPTPSPAAKQAWERFRQTHPWVGNAPWPIMLRLARTQRMVSQQLEEAIGLSTPQVRILFEALAPEGVSQAELHKQYQIDPASITRTVQAMERDGYITRTPDPNDNRLMRVHITDKGRLLTEEIPARMAKFERTLTSGLSETEVLQLHSLLERLEQGLEAFE